MDTELKMELNLQVRADSRTHGTGRSWEAAQLPAHAASAIRRVPPPIIAKALVVAHCLLAAGRKSR